MLLNGFVCIAMVHSTQCLKISQIYTVAICENYSFSEDAVHRQTHAVLKDRISEVKISA